LPQRSAQPKPDDAPSEEVPALPRRRVSKPKAAPAGGSGASAPRKPAARSARASTTVIRPVVADAPAANEPTALEKPRRAPRKTAHLAPAGALPPAHIPPEALRAPRHDRLLGAALIVSMVIHAVVLAIHFSPFDLRQLVDKGPPLEIALVNAKSKSKPTKADILAQANLDGGGNTDDNRRAKTPLPVMPKESAQNEVALAAQKVQALEQHTRELLTQMRSQAVPAPHPQPTQATESTDSPTANDVMQRTLEAIRLEAQIAKDMDAYQKRPKRRFVGARAQEYRFARYVEDWRLKVERVGNLNYPEAARAKKLYGSLLLTVSIRSDGSVEHVEVNKSSGHRILDAAAVKIVQMAAPYAAFPPEIKRDTDILHITRMWTFAKGDELRGE
jgi:protein TonB